MSKINYIYDTIQEENEFSLSLSVPVFNSFRPGVLGLGDIYTEGKYQEALAAVYDLEGFTSFCSQIEPHLVIPEFLQSFLNWLFQDIAQEFKKGELTDAIALWCKLPFFAKFTGDGVLFLWDTSDMSALHIGNVIASLINVSRHYSRDFLPDIKKVVTKSPFRLRCGIARGQVISIGNGEDYVGACINVASRIQKLSTFSYAFSRRGLSLEKHFPANNRDRFRLIRVGIRGLGEEELVYVDKAEFSVLDEKEQETLLA